MKSIDQCRARGCGGLLRAVGVEVSDGEITYCFKCKREHTFHVPFDGATAIVTMERKPRTRKTKAAR